MAAMAGCRQLIVGAHGVEVACSRRASSWTRASSSIEVTVCGFSARRVVDKRNSVLWPSNASLCGVQMSFCEGVSVIGKPRVFHVRAVDTAKENVGETPEWYEEDYVVLGLAHCFSKDDNQKLVDNFVIEPIPAADLERMENGGVTSYMHATVVTLGVALKQNVSLLPKEFSAGRFCEDFDFRTKSSSSTWKRDYSQEHLMKLVPSDGNVRSDWNFSVEEKRILNQEHVVNDSEEVKQDMSIDVHGRTEKEEERKTGQLNNVFQVPKKYNQRLQGIGILAAGLGIGTLAALVRTLKRGGSSALLSVVSKSGFTAAFALIFVSEIGDKTFFIAALLAMRHSKWLVLLGASGALAVMTVISVVIGKLFQRVPAQLQTTLPVGEYAAIALLVWFGLRSIKTAWDIPSAPAGAQGEPGELGELAEAQAFLRQANDRKVRTQLEVLGEAFCLIFVAEWGDRSMLATIALGAAQSPLGVASGAIAGHVLATLLAVLGGAILARYLSEKLIGYFGGFLFLVFAAATLAGVF